MFFKSECFLPICSVVRRTWLSLTNAPTEHSMWPMKQAENYHYGVYECTHSHACIMLSKFTLNITFCPLVIFQLRFGDTLISDTQLLRINSKPASIYVQDLAVMIFGRTALVENCLTGSATKGRLPEDTVQQLIGWYICYFKEEMFVLKHIYFLAVFSHTLQI